MHVDWDWIKQRPHYLAENLSKYYIVLVVCPYYITRTNLTKNSRAKIKLKSIPHVPIWKNLKLLSLLDNFLMRTSIRYLLKKFKPDYIWITFPELYKYLPSKINCNIIYDCMDDVGEFSDVEYVNSKRISFEIELIKGASLIFVSSENLMRVLNNRENCRNKMVLIRNAYDGKMIEFPSSEKLTINKNIYKIGYVGTVSKWLDFDSLFYCLQHINNIEFHIIGPINVCVDKWKHKRLIFHGPVNHDLLYSIVHVFDCMVIPFSLNNLILSVDPVKLYEYINFNEPIISIRYNEVERFSEFISFYSTKEELVDIIRTMINNGFVKKYSEYERTKLLNENSWDVRTQTILQSIRNFESNSIH